MTVTARHALAAAVGAVLAFLLFAVLPLAVSAEPVSGTCGDGVSWTLGDDGTMTVSGEGAMDDYDSIAEVPWYDLHASIKKVYVEDGVTTVGRRAFDYCEKLKFVSLSPSVEKICDNAFSRCYALEDIAVNGHVKEIGKEAFCDDDRLYSLYLGRGIEKIGESAFESCRALTSVKIPAGVTEIGDQAFFGCTGIVKATIPSTVEHIGQAAFGYCTSLLKITIPASAGVVPDYAFFGCSSLKSVTVSEGITSVGEEAFLGCTSLGFIYLPETLEEIAPCSVGYWYKYGYHKIEGLEIAAHVGSEGGGYAAENGFSLVVVDPMHVCSKKCEFCGKCLDPGCRYYSCYEKCPGHPFPVEGRSGNVLWSLSEDGTLTLTGSGEMTSYRAGSAPWYPYARLITRVLVEEGITSVGSYAFRGLYNAREIILPGGITSVGAKAFFDCTSLVAIDLPDTLEKVGDYAFAYCSSVRDVDLPDSVTSVGRFAFYRTPLETVSLGSVTSVGDCAFDTGGALREAALPATLVRIGRYAFGYSYSGGGFDKVPCFLITGESGSAAEDYAREHGFAFVTPDWTFPFTDVSATVWYRDPVEFAARRGLFGGVTETLFAPQDKMTRGMFVTVLWRMEGKPAPAGGSPFSDVKRGAYCEKAASWASENGIVNGVGKGKFDPNGGVTREQIAAMLMRYAGYRGADVSGRASLEGFPDGGSVSKYAEEALSWALDCGVVRGVKTEDGVRLNPRAGATRAEVATMIMRFAQRAG